MAFDCDEMMEIVWIYQISLLYELFKEANDFIRVIEDRSSSLEMIVWYTKILLSLFCPLLLIFFFVDGDKRVESIMGEVSYIYV